MHFFVYDSCISAGLRTIETEQVTMAMTYILWTPENKVAFKKKTQGRKF
jgi:hypothetical protein